MNANPVHWTSSEDQQCKSPTDNTVNLLTMGIGIYLKLTFLISSITSQSNRYLITFKMLSGPSFRFNSPKCVGGTTWTSCSKDRLVLQGNILPFLI